MATECVKVCTVGRFDSGGGTYIVCGVFESREDAGQVFPELAGYEVDEMCICDEAHD